MQRFIKLDREIVLLNKKVLDISYRMARDPWFDPGNPQKLFDSAQNVIMEYLFYRQCNVSLDRLFILE